MSDSEDEGAFASADEGEEEKKQSKAENKNKGTAGIKQEDKPKGGEATAPASAKTKKGKQQNVPAKAPEGQKDKGKNKKPIKKKGGGGTDSGTLSSELKKSVDAKIAEVKGEGQNEGQGKEVSRPDEKTEVERLEKEMSKTGMKLVETASDPPSKSSKLAETSPDQKEMSATKSTKSDTNAENIKTEDDKTSNNSEKNQIKSDIAQEETPEIQSIPRTVERVPTSEGAPVSDELAESTESEKTESGGWGWGSWGASLIDVASSSVSTFTSQVGEGFSTIVESVETTLGAPSPEELAKSEKWDVEMEDTSGNPTVEQPHKEEIKKENEVSKSQSEPQEKNMTDPEAESQEKVDTSSNSASSSGGGWFSSWGMSSLTSKIQNTGKSLVSGSLDAVEAIATGSLDVLETIGKKTIDVLSEHDPGFKKTRQVMFDKGKKQNLSSILREAKDVAEQKSQMEQESEEARKAHFGAMFDEYQGLAHLEALEILSNQSEKKVQALLSALPDEKIATIKPRLLHLKKIFEMENQEEEDLQEHEFSRLITEHLSELHLGTTPDKLNKVQEKIRQWIADFYIKDEGSKTEPKEVHKVAIQALAEITAKSVEQFHKAGELILLQKDSEKSYEDRSKSLASLTQVLCTEIGILSTKYSQCLNKVAEDLEDCSVVISLATNIYLESSNSSTYIQDAFQLLLPVLQNATMQNSDVLQT